MIVAATQADLDQITNLHLKALGNTPNSQIGGWLIRKLYRFSLHSKYTRVYLYKENSKIVGLISLALDMPKVVRLITQGFSLAQLCHLAYKMLLHPWTIISQLEHRLFMISCKKYLPPKYVGIMTIAVDGEHRGKNIGSKLISYIDRFIPTRVRSIYVDTYTANTSAINFYHKNGYHPVCAAFHNTLLKKDL